MNNTPTPVAPPTDSLHASFLKSLQLTVNPADPNPKQLDRAPEPDTGVEVPSTIDDFSEGSGSLADKLNKIYKTPTAPEPVAPAPVPEPTPTPPPVAITPPTTPTPVVPPPVTPPPEAKVEPTLPKITVPDLPRPFANDPVIPPPPLHLDISALDEDEQDEVQTAFFAEQRYPEKYKGHAQKVLDYIKKHKEYVNEKITAGQFDEDSEEYRRFLSANRPNITNGERKRLDRERLLEEAARMAEQKMSSKTRKLEDEVTQLKATPIVEKAVNDYKSMVKELMPKEDDPLVEEATQHMSKLAVSAAHEFMMLSNSLKPYDAKSDTHRWLADFIQEQGDLYAKSGHESLRRGSKTFVPRAKYNSLQFEERNKHFTFTDEDILQLIAVNAKAAAEVHVSTERARLKKAGYVRTVTVPPVSTPAPSAPIPSPDVSPRASPTVASGGSLDTPRVSDPFLKFMGR